MTDNRDRSDPIARWRATIDALEAIVEAAPDEPEIDPAEANEVRRLVMVRTAGRRRNTLPAAWARRPGTVPHLVPDSAATPVTTERTEPTPPSPPLPQRPRPAWHE
jgi:hypothetical protein